MKSKIYDCVTFYNENLQVKLRFNILNDYVDKFVICESRFDHKGNPKKLNFKINEFDNFKDKIIYLVLDSQFPKVSDPWITQAYQREFLLNNLEGLSPDDYIMFSDPDEIPKPELLVNFKLNKKFGIFMQKMFCYKLNIYNQYESPWEGTRIAKKKDLKSIDYLRQKILVKNLKYSFLRIDKEKSIEVFNDAGWHFNNIMDPMQISIKLKTFAHTEYNKDEFSAPDIIRSKIKRRIDLFDRGHQYRMVNLDNSFPKYLIENYELYKDFILP